VSRLSVSASVLALALLGSGAARAQLPEGAIGKWWKRPRVVETLHLTPEQQERLEAIFAKNRRSFIDLKADIEKRQVDLEELMARKDSEPKKVSSAVDAFEQAKLRLRKAHAMMVLDMRDILTSDQWRALLDRAEDARQMREERRLNRRGALRGPRGTPALPEGREKPDGE
jgi:Spy/CpxP family protein refolding chaperone